MKLFKYYKFDRRKKDIQVPVYGNCGLFTYVGYKVFAFLHSITLDAYLWFLDRIEE